MTPLHVIFLNITIVIIIEICIYYSNYLGRK
jgi:hypothetical protein